MKQNNSTIIQPGDLVTLKGMGKLKEKPIGMVKKNWSRDHIEIFWLNENIWCSSNCNDNLWSHATIKNVTPDGNQLSSLNIEIDAHEMTCRVSEADVFAE